MKTINVMSSATDVEFANPEFGSVLDLRGLPGQGNVILDRSACGNHGTITGATWYRLPSGLWANSFDGIDDNINLGLALESNNKSFLCWFYPKTAMAGVGFIINNENYSGAPNEKGWNLNFENSTLGFRIADGAGSAVTNSVACPTLNAWHFGGLIHDSTNSLVYLFLDGVLSAGTAITGYTANTIVHRLGWTNANTFNGYICLSKLFFTVLTSVQIEQSYQRERHLFGV